MKYLILFSLYIVASIKSMESINVSLKMNNAFKNGDEVLINCFVENTLNETVNTISLLKDSKEFCRFYQNGKSFFEKTNKICLLI